MKAAQKQHLLVLAGYIVLTLIMTAPLPLKALSHVAGSGGDPWQTMWRFEEKWSQLRESGFDFIAYDFGGQGEPRLVNLSVWPWMWAHLLLGQPAGYNLVWLLSFVIAGYGMYLLANFQFSIFNFQTAGTGWRSMMLREAPAFLAGAAYMFLPYRVAHAHGHFGAMQTGWLPLAALAAILFVRRPSLLRLTAFALLLAVQAWTEHHYFLWLLLLGAVAAWFYRAGVYDFLNQRRNLAYAAALTGLIFLLIVLPYWPTIRLAWQPDTQLAWHWASTKLFDFLPIRLPILLHLPSIRCGEQGRNFFLAGTLPAMSLKQLSTSAWYSCWLFFFSGRAYPSGSDFFGAQPRRLFSS
jgi:hypothetical protein